MQASIRLVLPVAFAMNLAVLPASFAAPILPSPSASATITRASDKNPEAAPADEPGLEELQRAVAELQKEVAELKGDGSDGTKLAELERRLNTVETRLDESVEACERLERQMAAQSEELRVQRAAIARTQRALRSLSRTDDEQATEPAIREPR